MLAWAVNQGSGKSVKTAPQNGAKQRGLEDAPAPAFPRRRLTSSEVKQIVDQAMEKLKEERPADYALLHPPLPQTPRPLPHQTNHRSPPKISLEIKNKKDKIKIN